MNAVHDDFVGKTGAIYYNRLDKIIVEVHPMTYGYIHVSARDQNEDCPIIALEDLAKTRLTLVVHGAHEFTSSLITLPIYRISGC